ATNLCYDVDFISVSNAKPSNRVYKRLNFFLTLPVPNAAQSLFSSLKMHAKSFQGAQMDKH
ncbi:unnamed protein product, partial [Staurois parvus]